MERLALIVEDDAALRKIYRRILLELNYTVLEATNGAEAIALLEAQQPDIVFLDMLLPQVNGETVLEYLANSPQKADIPVVIISSNRRFEQYTDLLPSATFLLKPVRPAAIRALATR
ncbi:MAG: hypothetical protein OHK0046_16090 [Anaerolineae bacterium]